MPDSFTPIRIEYDGARAVVYPHGAHVTSWTTADPSAGSGQARDERLYLSERAAYRAGTAIRGGVPIVFPQFANRGPLPKHGFARTRAWTVLDATPASVTLGLRDDAETRAAWPHAFVATYEVTLGSGGLSLALTVEHPGTAPDPLHFTAALHTYLRVRDVAEVSIEGLRGVRYRDHAGGAGGAAGVERTEGDAPLRIAGEVDRVYGDVPNALTVREPGRALRVDAAGFPDVVVWNPGAELAASLADLAPGDWRRFLCVEAAAVGRPVTVAPGERWTGTQRLTVER